MHQKKKKSMYIIEYRKGLILIYGLMQIVGQTWDLEKIDILCLCNAFHFDEEMTTYNRVKFTAVEVFCYVALLFFADILI